MPILTAQERIGTTLAERYEFTAILARGGMGVLFEAHDQRTGRPVVIKLLRSADLEDEAKRARFLQETRAICLVRHPNVVDVLDCGEADSLPYLVMERLRGHPLSEHLAQHGALAIEPTLELLLPIMGAAAHVHDAGLVHRDLKPSNIFLHRDPAGRTVPKLLDFGIAKGPDGSGLTSSGIVLGTPQYMAPEQATGGEVDTRSDVWSMGVLLYRCLGGRLPFDRGDGSSVLQRIVSERAPSLASVAPSLPKRLAAAIDRALERAPDARYGDMRELAQAVTVTAASAGVRLPAAPDPLGLPDFPRWHECGATGATAEASPRQGPAVAGHDAPRSRRRLWLALLTAATTAGAAYAWSQPGAPPADAERPVPATAPPPHVHPAPEPAAARTATPEAAPVAPSPASATTSSPDLPAPAALDAAKAARTLRPRRPARGSEHAAPREPAAPGPPAKAAGHPAADSEGARIPSLPEIRTRW